MAEAGHFGDGTLAQQLDAAYLAFTAFLKRRQAYCPQPPFRPSLATWLDIRDTKSEHGWVPCTMKIIRAGLLFHAGRVLTATIRNDCVT